ncbi:MAG: glycosyltransferase [Salibacteraceae bacterium]
MEKTRLNHIFWFAYYGNASPSVRYRASYPLEFARKELDIASQLVIPGYSLQKVLRFTRVYLQAMFCCAPNDLIVIQRVRSKFIYSSLLQLLVRVRGKNCVYDLDDADYLEHDPTTIVWFSRHCRYISAGSPAIADFLQEYNPNVWHITSPVCNLGLKKQHRSATFTIGWIGGFEWGHRESMFQLVFPAVKSLGRPCVLLLIGVNKAQDRERIRAFFEEAPYGERQMVQDIDWNDEEAIQRQIQRFDVGVATLSNDLIHLSKSGIKAKQYLNNGVPVVCNDLPENNRVVKHGFNGFVCDSAADFTNRLRAIQAMPPEEYWSLSANARASVANFDYPYYFQQWQLMVADSTKANLRSTKRQNEPMT